MKKEKNNEKRFEILLDENIILGLNTKIIRDRETGVHYLLTQNGGNGLTVLVDKDGKPIISD